MLHHWTDQKIHVHALYCVLALLMATLSHKIVKDNGIDVSLPKMLDELSHIREVLLVYSGFSAKGPKKSKFAISKMT